MENRTSVDQSEPPRGARKMENREFDRRLRRVGLYMKRFEVRGWRESSLTSFARLCLQERWGRPLLQAVSPGMQGRASPAKLIAHPTGLNGGLGRIVGYC